MQIAAAGVGLEGDAGAEEVAAEVAQDQVAVVAAALVQEKKAVDALEDVGGAGEAALRQPHGGDGVAGGEAGLQALAERAVGDALAVAAGLAEGDAEGVAHLLRV